MNDDQARATVFQALAKIAPEADPASVKGGERLRDVLDLDSIDFLGLVESLRALTGITIPERDFPSLETLNGLVGYLVTRSAG